MAHDDPADAPDLDPLAVAVSRQAAANIAAKLKSLGLRQYELAERIGVKPPHVSRMLREERVISIESLAKVANSLGVTVDELVAEPLPLYGEIPCGPPVPVTEGDASETIDLRGLFPRDELFVLRAKGQSMTGRGILSGDYILVRRTAEVVHGAMIAAEVDGEMTLAGCTIRSSRVKLSKFAGETEANLPYKVLRVVGVVVGVVRKVQEKPRG